MNADEIVKLLRDYGSNELRDYECPPYDPDSKCEDCKCPHCCRYDVIATKSADFIESLQAQLAESQRRERDARNELCYKCGRYREAHKGDCDGCRWKENNHD